MASVSDGAARKRRESLYSNLHLYNKGTGGVDLFDQHQHSYQIEKMVLAHFSFLPQWRNCQQVAVIQEDCAWSTITGIGAANNDVYTSSLTKGSETKKEFTYPT